MYQEDSKKMQGTTRPANYHIDREYTTNIGYTWYTKGDCQRTSNPYFKG